MEEKITVRTLETEKKFSLKSFFLQWEWMLVLILVAINIMNISASDNYWNFGNLMEAMKMFLDKAIMVFPMMLVILLGEIDVSVAATMALSGVIMGVTYHAGMPFGISLLLGLLTGTMCGFINGYLLVKFKELSSVIVTIATSIVFRGVASIILKDGATGNFPSWFQFFGWGYVGPFPFILVFFAIEAAIFAYIVHKTKFGRKVYAMGNNPVTSLFSGIKVDKLRLIIFTLNGLFAAVASIFLVSKMGSARPSIALGYELDVIAMVVLGGVSSAGGSGRVLGTILSIFIVGMLRYGLGIINVPSQTIMVVVGALLVISVAIPNIKPVILDSKPFKILSKK
ncbi:MAG: ABC transporter permease [Bacillota bacterium]|nr:ABC transporter permease [Bacillota bacterium]